MADLDLFRFLRKEYSIFLIKIGLFKYVSNKNRGLYGVKQKMDKLLILDYYKNHKILAVQYCKELGVLKKRNSMNILFPYDNVKELSEVIFSVDQKTGLPFVMHGRKKLYFPQSWEKKRIVDAYCDFIRNENILKERYIEKAPHQYITDSFDVKASDVVFDVGCAEGLFALDAVDRVKKVCLIEADPMWQEALHATFEPYKDKVEIINKLVTDIDSESTVTLNTLIRREQPSSFFVKMDIEGYETSVINASKDILSEDLDIRLACCTYHKQNDAVELEAAFSSLGYDCHFSDGYMLFVYDELEPPFFRKGVIRAQKNGT